MKAIALRLFSCVLCSILLIACVGVLGRELPEKRPHKIVVELYDGGGMSPEGTSYYICNDSCYVKFWRGQTTNILHYSLDSAQLDELYKTFYTNYFDKIKTKEMETYDRGGVTIYFRFADKNYTVSDAGSTYLLESWIKNFQEVESAIYKTASKAIAENTAPLVVKFGKEVISEKYAAYFNIEAQSYTTDSTRKESKTFNLLKGRHEYYISLSENTQPSYQRKPKANFNGVVDVCGQQDTLFVSLKDSTITCRKNITCTEVKK